MNDSDKKSVKQKKAESLQIKAFGALFWRSRGDLNTRPTA